MRIGMFDSGIGGLTVLKEMIQKFPKNQYYYFGDNLNIPYGTKTKKELSYLVENIIHFLKTKQVDIIIIACGTVSSTLYSQLKESCDIPIYEIIGPTIHYLNESDYQKIGLLATPMTIQSGIFQKNSTKQIIPVKCPKWVPLMEKGEYGEELDKAILEYTKKLKDVDCIVLGCTHYPIIEDKIAKICQKPIIHMGKVLTATIPVESHGDFKIHLYFSKVNHTLIENIERIIPQEYQLEEVVLCQNYQK